MEFVFVCESKLIGEEETLPVQIGLEVSPTASRTQMIGFCHESVGGIQKSFQKSHCFGRLFLPRQNTTGRGISVESSWT
jgi:hypothetical protein